MSLIMIQYKLGPPGGIYACKIMQKTKTPRALVREGIQSLQKAKRDLTLRGNLIIPRIRAKNQANLG